MKLLGFLYRQSRGRMLFATACSVLSGVAGTGLAGVISHVVVRSAPAAGQAWGFLGLCLLYLVAKCSSEIALLHLTQFSVFRLRISLSHKLLRTPLKQLQSMGKHGLLAILTKDVDAFILAFQLLPMALSNCIVIVGCLVYMAILSWQLFVPFAVCLLLCMGAYHLVERRPLAQLVKVRAQMERLYLHFRNLIEGSKELQLNARRGSIFVDQVIALDASAFRQSYTSSMTSYTWLANVGALLFYVVIGVLLFVIPLLWPQPMELLIMFALLLLYLIRPVSELMGVIPPLRQAAIALQNIQQLDLALVERGPLDQLPNPFLNRPLRLELRQACHQYAAATEDTQFMLGPLDLTVTEGEVLFIIGGNGSGKTTLAMLLLGLYAPEHGEVCLNGVAVSTENVDAYREHFSAVFADFHLFELLPYGGAGEMGERAVHYIKSLQMAHKVRIEDDRFSTIDLSTGQRKRLALVSSLLEDRPIYLFDEWAADQDPVFKRVFYTELLPELKARGKTVLVITHDDAYFSCADRIVKLDGGALCEVAPPQ